MHTAIRVTVACALVVLLTPERTVRGDAALPPNVFDPQSASEAWNVIRLATANVAQLLEERRMPEIPLQVSLCSPALRTLTRLAPPAKQSTREKQQEQAIALISSVVRAAQASDYAGTIEAFTALRTVLAAIAKDYDQRMVGGEIYICPMHPEFVSVQATSPCDKCGMELVTRRIPHSFIYVAPGKPSITMVATAETKLEVGRRVDGKIQLRKHNGVPVLPSDLLVMHTQPIHLLIVDASLGDYHHEHPKPTETAGEYAFSFTPSKPGSYRIWADLVPVTTGVQEYAVANLPSAARGQAIADKTDRFSTSAGGLDFRLTFGDEKPPRAEQIALMKVTVRESDARGVIRLEPVMNAFAHLVGFYEDYSTVVHLHPVGGEILSPDLRGGPTMTFKFYPPKPGFIRLYCQVQVDGKAIFAPFSLNVPR